MTRKLLVVMSLILGFSGIFACTKKQEGYTLESVNAKLQEREKEIISLRKKGKLENSANLAIKTGNEILNVFPMATMYRENVAKIVSAMGFLARLCSDKALHIRNESVNPEESQKYSKLSDDLYAMVDEIRRKMPSMPSNKPPQVKKVTPDTGEDAENPDAPADGTDKPDVEPKADDAAGDGMKKPNSDGKDQ